MEFVRICLLPSIYNYCAGGATCTQTRGTPGGPGRSSYGPCMITFGSEEVEGVPRKKRKIHSNDLGLLQNRLFSILNKISYSTLLMFVKSKSICLAVGYVRNINLWPIDLGTFLELII